MKNSAKVRPVPEGYATVTPYLIVDKGADAIEFYKKAFDAKEMFRHLKPDNTVGHAEIQIGTSRVMLADAYEEMGACSPKKYGGSPISIHLYVEDVDNVVAQAVKAGAKLLRAVENMFYGDRSGIVEDPYGHQWYVSTHIENLTFEEIKKRAATMHG